MDSALNLRTIIVIADIYRGLYSPAQHINTLHPPYLTFRHRSGVTPYISSYEFAVSCVFDKQSSGILSLRPMFYHGQTLSLTYGRFFAEFLEDLSLVRLGLLDLTTCVGLRYRFHISTLRGFSRKALQQSFPTRRQELRLSSQFTRRLLPGFA